MIDEPIGVKRQAALSTNISHLLNLATPTESPRSDVINDRPNNRKGRACRKRIGSSEMTNAD